MKILLLAAGGVLVAGGLFLGYWALTKNVDPSRTAEYDEFSAYRLEGTPSYNETPATCKEKCSKNKDCKGAAFEYANQACTISPEDPFVAAKPAASGAWSVFVKRPKGQAPSKWGPWAPKCDGVTKMQQTRQCEGVRCLGESQRYCDFAPPSFDRFVGMRVDG